MTSRAFKRRVAAQENKERGAGERNPSSYEQMEKFLKSQMNQNGTGALCPKEEG